MVILLYMMLIAGPLVALALVLEALQKKRRKVVLTGICAVLITYGWCAFMAQALGACGGLPFIGETFNWPILFTDGAVKDSAGRRYIPHTAAGRIQVYDMNGNFLRGWFIDAGGGVFKLHVTSGDELEVFTARGDRHLVFDAAGRLIREGRYPGETYDALPVGPACKISLGVPWLLLPLTSPFLAWLVAGIGFVGLGITRKIKTAI